MGPIETKNGADPPIPHVKESHIDVSPHKRSLGHPG
jgi:hypothetical protein